MLVCYVLAPGIPAWLAVTFRPIYRLFVNKWYFDDLYRFLFVRPYFWVAHQLWQAGDVPRAAHRPELGEGRKVEPEAPSRRLARFRAQRATLLNGKVKAMP